MDLHGLIWQLVRAVGFCDGTYVTVCARIRYALTLFEVDHN